MNTESPSEFKKPSTLMKIINWAILITLPIVVLILLMLAYLAFWPIDIIKPLQQPYKVLTKSVKAGDILIYEVNACKYYELESVVFRTFSDDLTYTAPPVPNTVHKGCGKTKVTIEIPKNLPPDNYHLDLKIVYHVNFIHEVEYNFKTEDFTVTK